MDKGEELLSFICTCGWLDYRVGLFLANMEFVFLCISGCLYMYLYNGCDELIPQNEATT